VPARRVLITGVGSYLGTLLASRLERESEVEAVIGIDTRRPKADLGRTEFHEADIRDTDLARLIKEAAPDVVVHNKIVRQPGPGMSSRAMHDINVIGSLQLLAACERVPSIESIVIRGSAGIYGAEPHAPQFLGEEMTQLFPLRNRFQRDVAEIENYFETFSRRRPQVTCTMLRYQPAIGPSLDTQITRYLSQPACPTYLGFDPRIQLVHEHDALEALLAAIRTPVRGAVNVAGRGTIGLARMIRMAGRPPFPIAGPLFGPLTGAARRLGLGAYSDDFQRLLRHGRAVDVRRLEEEVGYEPRYSTLGAVQDWVARRGEASAA
jgi:UDP-glucose 4-epimerase